MPSKFSIQEDQIEDKYKESKESFKNLYRTSFLDSIDSSIIVDIESGNIPEVIEDNGNNGNKGSIENAENKGSKENKVSSERNEKKVIDIENDVENEDAGDDVNQGNQLIFW